MSDSPTPRTDAVQADLGKDHGDMVLHAETLERENAALRKDAERYRWLRNFSNFLTVDAMLDTTEYNTLDEAVDYAMEPRQP